MVLFGCGLNFESQPRHPAAIAHCLRLNITPSHPAPAPTLSLSLSRRRTPDFGPRRVTRGASGSSHPTWPCTLRILRARRERREEATPGPKSEASCLRMVALGWTTWVQWPPRCSVRGVAEGGRTVCHRGEDVSVRGIHRKAHDTHIILVFWAKNLMPCFCASVPKVHMIRGIGCLGQPAVSQHWRI